MAEACERAKIEPPANFHCLRHTYASHAVMAGAPLIVVAQNLGHADTRMVEKHYGHLSESYVAEAIRAAAPRFGIATTTMCVRSPEAQMPTDEAVSRAQQLPDLGSKVRRDVARAQSPRNEPSLLSCRQSADQRMRRLLIA